MRWVIVFLSYFLWSPLSAQIPSFKIGAPYKTVDASKKYYFSYPSEHFVFSIKENNNKITLQRFDLTTLQEQKRSPKITLPHQSYIYDVVRLGEKIYLLQIDYSNGKKHLKLFAQQINIQHCTLIDSLIPVLEGNNISFIQSQQRGEKGHLLLLGFEERKKNQQRFAYCNVLSEHLTSIGKQQLHFPHQQKQTEIIDFQIDQQGTPYVLTKVHPIENYYRDIIGKGQNAALNYHLEILKFDLKKGSCSIDSIPLQEHQIVDSWLTIDTHNVVSCAGFYSKKSSTTIEPDGIFALRPTSENGIFTYNHYEFSIELLTRYKNALQQNRIAQADRKGDAEMQALKLKNILVQKDNSLLIIGEIDFVVHASNVAPNRSIQPYTSYNYQDILLAKIYPNGELAWIKKLPKRQIGNNNRGEMSFKYVLLDQQHYLFYLDHEHNKAVSVYEFPDTYVDGKQGVLTAYKVDDLTGKIQKAQILDNRQNKSPYKFFQFDVEQVTAAHHSIIVEFHKKAKEDILIRINLK